MASSVIILKPVNGYLSEKAMKSFKKAVVNSGILFNKVELEYNSNKVIVGAEGSIGFIDSDGKLQQFIFTISNTDEYSESSFDWLVPTKGLFWAIDIENIGMYHRQIFNFAVSYFAESPNDYLWLDSAKWVYSAKEIKMLSQLPYSPKWLYEKIQL